MFVHISKKSANVKTGRMPVTTSDQSSCPSTCPHKAGNCYAKSGFHLNLHWQKTNSHERGGSWSDLCDFVRYVFCPPSYHLANVCPHFKEICQCQDRQDAGDYQRSILMPYHMSTPHRQWRRLLCSIRSFILALEKSFPRETGWFLVKPY